MPFRDNEVRLSPIVPHSAPVDRREFETPSFGQTVGAAFRQENDVLNALGWLTQPVFEPDPNFDPLAAARASRLAGEYFPELVGTRSQAEFAAKEARIQQELKDKQILGQAGMSGFLAAMAAGTLSPTVLIPAMGPARGLKGAVQAFALAATGAAISEGTLYATQETRTLKETAVGVAAGTVLGGLMGTAARHLTPDEMFRGEAALRAAQRGELSIRLPDGEEVPLLEEAAPARAILPEGRQESVNASRTFVADDSDLAPGANDVFWHEFEAAGRAPDGSHNLAQTDPELYELLRAPTAATSPDSPVQIDMIRKALARGRMDIAEALANRMAREARRASEAVPGVSSESPRYESILAGLKERANYLREYATKAEEIVRGTSPPELLDLQAGARQVDAVDARLSSEPALSRTADGELPEGMVARADMAPSPADRAIPETRGTESVGAAVANPRNYGGLVRPTSWLGSKAFNFFSRLSPITRLMVQDFSPAARYWTSMIQNPGLRQADGVVNAAQGTIFSRRQIHQAKLADFIVQMEDAYWRHLYGDYVAPPGQKVDILARLRMGTLGVPPGKLSYKDFGEAVFDTLNTGKAHSEGAVNTAAKVMDDVYDYYRTVARDYAEERSLLLGEDVKPLFGEDDGFLGQGIQNYVTHAFDKDYIVRNADEFLRDFSAQGEYLYRDRFASSFARYRDRRAGLERMRSFTGMTPEQLTGEWDRLQMRKEEIQLDPDYQQSFNQLMQDRRAYRAKLVEEGAPDIEKAVARFVREQQRNFPDRVRELEKERKQIVRLSGHLEGLGANVELQRGGLYEKVMELQRLQNGAFERIASQTAAFARKMDRLGKKVEGGDVKRVLAAMDKELAQLRKREAAIDLAAEKNDGLRGWKESAAWAKKMRKVESLRERLAKAEEDQLDASAKGLILEEAHHWAVSQAREANYLRALREEKVLSELDELSPEALAAKGEAQALDLDREIQNLDDTFQSRWESEGAQGDILAGKPDFADAAVEDANELYRRLTGAPDRAVGMELVGAKRGAQLARVLSMPYETKRKYLIRDPEQVLRRYGRTMDSDLELWRVTGSVNGAKIFDEIKEDFAARRVEFAQATHILPSGGKKMAQVQSALSKVSEKAPILLDPKLTLAKGDFVPAGAPVPEGAIELTPSMREAYSTLLSQQEKAVAKDMSVVIDRLRHDRGYAADTNATGYRLGRFALNAQVTMMMGKVVLSSLSDVQRPWAKYGIGRTISKGWAPFIQNATFRKTLMESDRRKAIGLDPLLHNRAQAFADVYNTAPVYANRAVGKVEKGMELLANKTGLVALFDYWTAMNKHVASSITQVEMADNIAVVMGRVPATEKEMAWAKKNLQRIGVSDDLARRIDYQMQLPDGGTDLGRGMRLPNTDAWDDPSLVRAYAAIVNNEVDNLIITPGLDLPNMADENMGYRLLFQFKSFTFAATPRVHMSMLQGNDPYAMQYALGSLAMGALSYYTWAMSAGGKSWEDAQKADPGTVLYEALDRSGLTGVASLGTKVGEQIPGLSDYWIFGGEERTSRRNSDLISAVLGPTASSLNRAAQIAMEWNEPTQSTLHKARGFVPYNNHFLLDRLLDKLEGWAYDAFDVPESRKDK